MTNLFISLSAIAFLFCLITTALWWHRRWYARLGVRAGGGKFDMHGGGPGRIHAQQSDIEVGK